MHLQELQLLTGRRPHQPVRPPSELFRPGEIRAQLSEVAPEPAAIGLLGLALRRGALNAA